MTALSQLSGALAGRYEIEREIGSGGMATVYLARDVKHARRVALKLLDPELGAVLGAERFLSEIRVTANLQHPNLLPLFDSGETGGLLFYVMPFVDGETLRARLDREKQLPVDEAVRIAVALAGALAYAHEHEVIHRDLKPENILMQAGQPVIADFGIALAVSKAGGARVTQTGLSLGTPQYMSPEQAAGDRIIDGRSDVYSLAAVTYEMLAGEPPHSGTNAQAVIAKLMTAAPAPLRSLRASVPAHVAAAVETALAKVPADRFATASEFAQALRNPGYTTVYSELPNEWHTSADARRTRRTFHVTAALGVTTLAFALAAWMRPEPPRQILRYALAMDSADALAMRSNFGRAALSFDGSQLAYVGGANRSIMVRPRDQLRAVTLAGTEGAQMPFFSPDGTRVGYLVSDRMLAIAPIGGGRPIQVADSLIGPFGVSWGVDDRIYADGIGLTSLVRVAPAANATPERFTRLDATTDEVDHIWPHALPGGKGVLFNVTFAPASARSRYRAIALADVTTGRHRILLEDAGHYPRYSRSGHIVYAAGGVLMAVAFDERTLKLSGSPFPTGERIAPGEQDTPDLDISPSGTLMYGVQSRVAPDELVLVARDGATTELDSAWGAAFVGASLSPDGARIAARVTASAPPRVAGRTGTEIWTKTLRGGSPTKLRVDSDGRHGASWTPDGKAITYSNYWGTTRGIWSKAADGSNEAVRLYQPDREVVETLWSPDGQWLIMRTATDAPGRGDIIGIRPGIDRMATPLAATGFIESSPTLSPDGRWMAYQSNESGQHEVYVVPFPNTGGAKRPVSPSGGLEPLWSPRGNEIFYRTLAGDMVTVEVDVSPTFSLGRTTTLFSASMFKRSASDHTYGVVPDGQRFVMVRPGASVARLIFVENWFETLKRRKAQ
jgi:serine/threonine-protein kinase